MLKNEKEKYDNEINNINEKILNLHKQLNIINDNTIFNQKENENINKFNNEKFNLEYDITILKNKIKNAQQYNDELINKINEINNTNISLNNNYDKKIKDFKNELNVKNVERDLIINNYKNKYSEYENENNNLKMEIKILQIKIKNIETDLELKKNCLDNIIVNDGEFINDQNNNNIENILINKLKSDNKNLFTENYFLSEENKRLKQKIEFLSNQMNENK